MTSASSVSDHTATEIPKNVDSDDRLSCKGREKENCVSVVIPFYRAEEFFAASLESVLKQSVKAAEIIVVNDSPSASSISFLENFVSDCTIITLDKNYGVSHARNVGAKAASSEWLAFLDADDLWSDNKLELQLDYLRSHPECKACHTGVRVFNGDIDIISYTDKPERLSPQDLLLQSHVVPSSFIISRAEFLKFNGFDVTIPASEDYDLIIRLIKEGIAIDFLGSVLTSLRRENQGNLSGNWKKLWQGNMKLLKKHNDFFTTYGGKHATRKFYGQAMQLSGSRRGGLIGKLMCIAGRLLGR